jgi:hypothetical protein
LDDISVTDPNPISADATHSRARSHPSTSVLASLPRVREDNAAGQPHAAIVLAPDNAIAVVFDLVNPRGPARTLLYLPSSLRRYIAVIAALVQACQ